MLSKVAIIAALAAASIPSAVMVHLNQETVAAFESYAAQAEAQIEREESSRGSFLVTPSGGDADRETRLKRGEVLVDTRGTTPKEVPGGLIHRWLGTTFIANTTVPQVLRVLQDYDHLARYYQPEVLTSRLISRDADDFSISMRVSERHVFSVVLDTEYRVHYGRLDADHQYSFARSTRVAEIDSAGESSEHPLPEGYDHGFLWRLNTYWRFVQAADGVYVQCEAVSLTRDVPTGLGWLVGPFIENIPRESLQSTLSATRTAVLTETKREVK